MDIIKTRVYIITPASRQSLSRLTSIVERQTRPRKIFSDRRRARRAKNLWAPETSSPPPKTDIFSFEGTMNDL